MAKSVAKACGSPCQKPFTIRVKRAFHQQIIRYPADKIYWLENILSTEMSFKTVCKLAHFSLTFLRLYSRVSFAAF